MDWLRNEYVILVVACFLSYHLGSYKATLHEQAKCQSTQKDQQRERDSVSDKAQLATEKKNAENDQLTAKVDAHVQEQLEVAIGSANSLRVQLDGMRDTLGRVRASAVSQGKECAALSERVRTLTEIQGECVTRYSEVAEEADRLTIILAGWQQLEAPL